MLGWGEFFKLGALKLILNGVGVPVQQPQHEATVCRNQSQDSADVQPRFSNTLSLLFDEDKCITLLHLAQSGAVRGGYEGFHTLQSTLPPPLTDIVGWPFCAINGKSVKKLKLFERLISIIIYWPSSHGLGLKRGSGVS